MAAKAKKKRATKAQKQKIETARATMASKVAAAVVAAAAIWQVSAAAAKSRVANIRKNLLSLGTAVTKANALTVVYGDADIKFHFAATRHVKGAKRRVDGDCPLARALKDSFLSEYITHAHVGNNTVKLWNVMCPDMVVKFVLSPSLAAAVKQWDETGRWVKEDGIYAVCVYPVRSRLGNNDRSGKTTKTRTRVRQPYGPRVNHPTRRITLQSDIALAMEAATMLKKKPAKKVS